MLPEDVLHYNIEHISVSTAASVLASRYDHSGNKRSLQFASVIITDVDANAPSYKLKAAALRHAKLGGLFIQVPHGTEPLNEFFNLTMFLTIYPSPFPYGTGGFEDGCWGVPIGLETHVKHTLALNDGQFFPKPTLYLNLSAPNVLWVNTEVSPLVKKVVA